MTGLYLSGDWLQRFYYRLSVTQNVGIGLYVNNMGQVIELFDEYMKIVIIKK